MTLLALRRWCSDHSAVPVLLVPPAMLESQPGLPPSNSIVVAGAGNLDGLKSAFEFAVSCLLVGALK